MKYRDPKTGDVFEDIAKAAEDFCYIKDCDFNHCPIDGKTDGKSCADWISAHPADAARLMGLEVVEDTIPGVTQGVKSLFCEHIGVLPGQPFIVHGYPYRNYPPMVYGDDGCVRLYSPDGQKRHKVGGRAITWIVDHPESVEPCEGYTPQEMAFKKEDSMDKTDKPRLCEVLGSEDNPLEVDEVWCVTGNDRAQYRITYDGNLEYRMPNYNGTGYGRWISTDVPTDFIAHPDRILRKPRFTQEEVADAKSITRLIDGSTAAEIERMETGTLRLLIPLSVIGKKIIDLDCTIFPSLRPGQAVRLEAVIQ